MTKDWITISDAATLSGYHPERVRELVREGRVRAQKFGPVWQVSRSSLLDYVRTMGERGERRGPKKKALDKE